MTENYVPNNEVLEKYADVMVNFALNKGEGIRKGEVVELQVPEVAKPILPHLYKKVLEAGAHPLIKFLPDDMETLKFDYGSDEQIGFYPEKLMKGKIDEINHTLMIIADKNPTALKDIDPKKIMIAQKSMLPYRKLRDAKENTGKFSWTLCLYGTEAVAKEAGMSLKEYWDEIIKVCFLDQENPVQVWRDTNNEIQRICKVLTEMKIDKAHVEAEGTDLWVSIGEQRKWLGGRGNNIPSFEVFTSPDWRGINGKIKFTEPLYRYGNLVKGIELEVKDGIVVNFKAEENENLLKEMLEVENGNKFGEFSMTDGRMSKITKFMAETLYDENVGGKNGNSHLAIGTSFDEAYDGPQEDLGEELYERLGFNKCAIHTDIVSTSNRKVTAYMKDGSSKVIYEDGQFRI